MGDQPFIKFYPSDFLGGTSGLSPAERGVYITLLCLMYENDGPILRDDSRLSRRCGSPKAAFIRALDSLLAEGKLVEVDGMLTNKRAEKAIVDRANRTQNSTHAAKQRWGAQAGKSEQNQSNDYAGAMPEQCVGDASQKPEPEPERDTNVSLCKNGFDDFWSAYPKKVEKDAARKAWAKAVKRSLAEDIIEGARQYAAVRHGQDLQYTKNPSSWLNDGRWKDETLQPAVIAQSVDRAAFWAESIKANKYVSPATCPPQICREMVQRGLVTQRQILEKGLSI